MNSSSEVNIITPNYAVKLGLYLQKTSIKAQKIGGLFPKTYRIASAKFLIQDSSKRV